MNGGGGGGGATLVNDMLLCWNRFIRPKYNSTFSALCIFISILIFNSI
jgi:hypothetical protein